MILAVILLTLLTVSLVALCTKHASRNPSTSIANRPNLANATISPQTLATPRDSTLVASVTPPEPDSPPRSQHTQPNPDCTTPHESGGPSKGASPANNTGTGTGTTPGNDATGGTATPQSSVKKRDGSNRSKDNEPPTEESANLMIKTVSTVPDSLMERGNTTKTKEGSKYTPPSRKGRKFNKRKTILREVTAKTLQSPLKKTEKEKEKDKKDQHMVSSSGPREKDRDNQADDEYKEHTGECPTDEKGKTNVKADKDENKTKEDKRSVEGKLSTAPSVPIDSTQCSHTRKVSHK